MLSGIRFSNCRSALALSDHVGRSYGMVELTMGRALRPDTTLVSIMLANNEVGTTSRRRDRTIVRTRCDLHRRVQAAGTDQCRQLGVDLLSISKTRRPQASGRCTK